MHEYLSHTQLVCSINSTSAHVLCPILEHRFRGVTNKLTSQLVMGDTINFLFDTILITSCQSIDSIDYL